MSGVTADSQLIYPNVSGRLRPSATPRDASYDNPDIARPFSSPLHLDRILVYVYRYQMIASDGRKVDRYRVE